MPIKLLNGRLTTKQTKISKIIYSSMHITDKYVVPSCVGDTCLKADVKNKLKKYPRVKNQI